MIPLLKARIAPSAAERVGQVLQSGFVNVGPTVAAFEAALSRRLGAGEVLCTSSCTSALVLSLLAANAHRKRVITTPMTFVATTAAIYQAGAEPLWADVESPFSCQVGPASVRIRVTDEVCAIVAVAWAGWLPDLAALRILADEADIPLILDAAQAFGATYAGRPLHEWADFTCYSFGPTKHVTCGDGGALLCRNPVDRERVRRLSWFGMRRTVCPPERVPSDQDIREPGYKAHTNEIAAAVGLSNLETLDEALFRARAVVARYDREIPATRHEARPETQAAPWLYTIFVDDPGAFIDHAARCGVAVAQPHRRNDTYPFAAAVRRNLRNTDAASAHYVCLPVGFWLSDQDVDQVIAMVRSYPGQVL